MHLIRLIFIDRCGKSFCISVCECMQAWEHRRETMSEGHTLAPIQASFINITISISFKESGIKGLSVFIRGLMQQAVPGGQYTSVTSGLQGLSCWMFFYVLQVRTMGELSMCRPVMRYRAVATGGSWSDSRRTMWCWNIFKKQPGLDTKRQGCNKNDQNHSFVLVKVKGESKLYWIGVVVIIQCLIAKCLKLHGPGPSLCSGCCLCWVLPVLSMTLSIFYARCM